MELRVVGSASEVRLEQPWKRKSLSRAREVGRVTEAREVHPLKTPLPR
jgi:hypothetical protein